MKLDLLMQVFIFFLKRNAMNEAMQPLELVCRHFAIECNDAQIAKLRKEKARAHQRSYALRQENARLRNDLYSCRRALGRMRQCIDTLRVRDGECTQLLQALITKLDARRQVLP